MNNYDLFPYNKFDENQLATELITQIERLKKAIKNLENRKKVSWELIKDNLHPKIFSLNHLWQIIEHLISVKDSKEIRKIYNKFQPIITKIYINLNQSTKLYNHYQKIKDNEFKKLSDIDKRILDIEFKEFFLNGITLTKDKRLKFKVIENELTKLANEFDKNILDDTNNFIKYVNKGELAGIPLDVLDTFEIKDNKYKLTLNPTNYLVIMEYCQNRNLRKELYFYYVTRASKLSSKKYDNESKINKILDLRYKKSRLLNFNNYAELSLYNKMLTSPDEVIKFLRELANKARNQALNEYDELKVYAHEYAIKKVEAWDISFLSEKLRQKNYNYSNEELRQHFTLESVLNGLFELINKLYKINFQRNMQVPTWDEEVYVFEVIKDESIIGYLYCDFFFTQ